MSSRDCIKYFHPYSSGDDTQCRQRGTVLRNGGYWYCDEHDPHNEQEARDEYTEHVAKQRTAACLAACDGVPTADLKPGMVKEMMGFVTSMCVEEVIGVDMIAELLKVTVDRAKELIADRWEQMRKEHENDGTNNLPSPDAGVEGREGSRGDDEATEQEDA